MYMTMNPCRLGILDMCGILGYFGSFVLESDAGQRHQGAMLSIAQKIWPRWFIRQFFPNAGLFMLIEARK
jgi:hypothetical protein